MANVNVTRDNIAEVSDEDFFAFFGGVVVVNFVEVADDEDEGDDDGFWVDCSGCGHEADGSGPCPCSQA